MTDYQSNLDSLFESADELLALGSTLEQRKVLARAFIGLALMYRGGHPPLTHDPAKQRGADQG